MFFIRNGSIDKPWNDQLGYLRGTSKCWTFTGSFIVSPIRYCQASWRYLHLNHLRASWYLCFIAHYPCIQIVAFGLKLLSRILCIVGTQTWLFLTSRAHVQEIIRKHAWISLDLLQRFRPWKNSCSSPKFCIPSARRQQANKIWIFRSRRWHIPDHEWNKRKCQIINSGDNHNIVCWSFLSCINNL